MMRVDLVVNGTAVGADVEPRLHLADFLREHLLLTGTHLGCEHGVCGACTVLLDGEPARSCIAFAANCQGRDVRSIEGLEDDPITARLRDAFTAEHALQCGYCTPGMLVTARDIVQRLPGADEDRIRVELAGNLCRCTGYNGIVRAIQRVLRDPPAVTKPPAHVPRVRFTDNEPVADTSPAIARPASAPPSGGPVIEQRIALAAPLDVVWAALQNTALIASCVPGATITEASDGHVAGMLTAGLGPIQARFAGQGAIAYDPTHHAGTITGEGRDTGSGTRLQAQAAFRVERVDATHCILVLSVSYGLRGPLAQFARGPLVRAFADEIAAETGLNLDRRLGGAAPTVPAAMPAGSLILRSVWRWLRSLMSPSR